MTRLLRGGGVGGQAILQQLDRPLLCTSVTGLAGEAEVAVEVEDAAVIMDQYAGRGIDFVVDAGIKVGGPHVYRHGPALYAFGVSRRRGVDQARSGVRH